MTQATADILSQAFAFAELAAPSSFGDGSPEVQRAQTVYPGVLDECLGWADWSFASKLLSLPPASDGIADPDLPGVWQLPSEVLKLRKVDDGRRRWRLDGRLLRADATITAALKIRATVRVEREVDLPGEFRKALALELAARISPPATRSANRSATLDERTMAQMKKAARADRQGSPERWDGGPPGRSNDFVAEVLR
ncbi:MAG: hypothetical protein AAF192_16385 [Pseudomonadota bacterium]